MLLLSLPILASATPTEVVVEADHLELEDGGITGEGVALELGERVVTASALQAVLDDGVVHLESVLFAPCACEGLEPWSVQAEQATWVMDEAVRLQGAWFRVFDVPVVPLPPATVPLRRRSGVLPPTVGYGPYGLLVAQPVYFTATDQGDETQTPELRSAWSARMIAEGRYALRGGGGEVRTALGRDWEVDATRGAIQWEHAQAEPGHFLASRGQLLGDEAYLRDYGDRFLDRTLPFVEARTLGGWGPLEVGSRTTQYGGPTAQDVASMALRRGGIDGPWGLVHAVELFSGWSVWGTVPWDASLGAGQVHGRTTTTRPTWIGPVRATPELGLLALADSDVATGEQTLLARSQVAMDTRLGLWRDGDRAYERLEPGVRVEANPEALEGQLAPGLRVSPWVVSPGVWWRRTSQRGLVALRAALPLDGEGWAGQVDGRLLSGPWKGWLQLESRRLDTGRWVSTELLDLGTVGLGWGEGPVDLSASWIYADRNQLPQTPPDLRDLHQGRWAVGLTPPVLSVLRLDGGAAHRLDEGALQQAWLGMTYTHPTECVRLGARGWWDADRAAPEAALKADFRL